MGREVITIQAGSFANYTGAHFWNFQEELLGLAEQEGSGYTASQIAPDVLFTQTEIRQGQIEYTPRLVLFDLSGSLGGASQSGAGSTAHAAAAVSTWGGPVAVHRAAPAPRSRFAEQLELEPEEATEPGASEQQDAAYAALAEAARELDSEGGVRSWTDYLKAHLHPRSVSLLPGLWAGVAEWSGYGHGHTQAALGSEEPREDAMDRIRAFAEECDSLQGLQYFVEDLNGWGHFSQELLQLVQDEYAGTPVLLFALRPLASEQLPGLEANALRQRRISEAVSLARLSEVSSSIFLWLPRGIFQAWRPGNVFHASALCASVIDTATLPYRLARDPPTGPLGTAIGACNMRSLCDLLRASPSNNVAAAFAAVPCPELPGAHAAAAAADARSAIGAAARPPPFTSACTVSWTPGIPADVRERLAESVVLRGPERGCRAVRSDAAAEALDSALLPRRHQVRAPPLRRAQALPSLCPSRTSSSATAQGLPRTGLPIPAARMDWAADQMALCNSQTGDLAKQQLHAFQGAVSTGAGRAILQGWGYSGDDVAEVEERLQVMASAFESSDEFY